MSTAEPPPLHKIILTPVDGGSHTEDSDRTVADCGHECWIATTSRKAVASPFLRTETVCIRCVDVDVLRKQLAAQGGAMTLPGVRAELNRVLGVAETDQLFARYKIQERIGGVDE